MASSLKVKTSSLPKGFIAVCVLPTLFLSVVFMIVPAFNALQMSFTNAVSMVASDNLRFIGLENYVYLFTRDQYFRQALWNTFRLMVVVPALNVFIGLFFAFLLTQTKLKERGLYRVVFFFPSVISLTVVGVVWACLFDPRSTGVINKLIGLFGAGSIPWLGEESLALWCIAVVLVWQAAGYYMVMHIAAIDSISTDIYEAASIDGAKGVHKFFLITIPLLKDAIGITWVLSLSGTINLSYVLSNVMTNGGPGNATLVLLQYIYRTAFGVGANFGYAMSITVFSLVLAFVLSMLSRKVSYSNENTKG
jgi:N-acetylglucosamine transport system permease protein